MNKQNDLIDCEKPPYWYRVKQSYKENGMLYHFYKFLEKVTKRNKKKGGKNKCG